MTTVQNPGSDHRRTMAVAEDAQRIAHLAQELQRNALELEGQSHKLRGTLEALESANEKLDRRSRMESLILFSAKPSLLSNAMPAQSSSQLKKKRL